MSKQKVVYVCGPMSGYPDHNRPAFRAMTELLRGLGYRVISPDELDTYHPITKSSWKNYMARDLAYLGQVDMAVVLPGWQQSRGALLETCIFKQLDVPVYHVKRGELVRLPRKHLPNITVPPVLY
jgi:hypothetical protein